MLGHSRRLLIGFTVGLIASLVLIMLVEVIQPVVEVALKASREVRETEAIATRTITGYVVANETSQQLSKRLETVEALESKSLEAIEVPLELALYFAVALVIGLVTRSALNKAL